MNVIYNKVSNPGSLGHEETPFITMQLDDNHDLCLIFIIIKVFSGFFNLRYKESFAKIRDWGTFS